MKITRREALAVLEINEGATQEEIKRAYHKMSLRWHPDKHPEDDRKDATTHFQKIAASYSVLTKQGPDSEDEDSFFYGEDEEFDFAAHLFAALFGMHMGGGFAPRGYAGRPRAPRGSNAGPSQPKKKFFVDPETGKVYVYDADSDDGYYASEEEEEEEDEFEDYVRHFAGRQQARQQQQQQQSSLDSKVQKQRTAWLSQFKRLSPVAITATTITLSADSKKPWLKLNRGSGSLDDSYWELRYRPVEAAEACQGGLSEWRSIGIASSQPEAKVTGLQPDTEYAFQARPCIEKEGGVATRGPWNEEARVKTKSFISAKKKGGSGEKKSAAAAAPPPAAAETGAEQMGKSKTEKNRAKKARQKAKKAAARTGVTSQ